MRISRNLALAIAVGVVAGIACQAHATIFVSDNFYTYASGDLVGQNGWAQVGATATLPLQVSGGLVVIPGAQSADNQDAWKDLAGGVIAPPGSGTTSIFYGLALTVQSAPALGVGGITSPSYFAAIYNGAGGTGFANERLAAVDNSANIAGTYFLAARITGQAGDPFTYCTTPLFYGTLYNVVVQCDMVAGTQNDTLEVFVDDSPYLSNFIGTGTDPAGMGSLVISQFASATVGNAGVTIGAVRIADNYAEAVVPEPGTLALLGLGVAGLLIGRRR